MKPLAALATAFALALVGLGAWRIVAGVESWFDRTPAAGNIVLWSLVAALILAVFAIPAAAWGFAARAWATRLRQGEHLESHAHVIARAHQRLTTIDVPALPAPQRLALPDHGSPACASQPARRRRHDDLIARERATSREER